MHPQKVTMINDLISYKEEAKNIPDKFRFVEAYERLICRTENIDECQEHLNNFIEGWKDWETVDEDDHNNALTFLGFKSIDIKE